MESGVKKTAKANPLSFFSYMENGSDSDDGDAEEGKKPEDDGENPFSFKAFDPTVKLSNRANKETKRGSRGEDLSTGESARSNSSLNSSALAASPLSLGMSENEESLESPALDFEECADCKRLNKENKRLHSKLQETLESAAQLQRRVNKLSAQLKARDERETAEASQLEEMLHQVEKNLHQSTKRADKAEKTVDRLTKEIMELRALLQGGDGNRAAREAGAELVERSAAAKVMLKELLKGVDRVAIVGESLQTAVNFSEI